MSKTTNLQKSRHIPKHCSQRRNKRLWLMWYYIQDVIERSSITNVWIFVSKANAHKAVRKQCKGTLKELTQRVRDWP